MLGRMLEQKGMSLDDVELVLLGKVSAVMAALESNQIDGAILNEPNITKMQTAGTAQTMCRLATSFLIRLPHCSSRLNL